MSLVSSIYKKLALSSPRMEVAIRCFYWNNVNTLMRYRNISSVSKVLKKNESADFEKVISFIHNLGVKDDDIMLIHSSYDSLRGTGLEAAQIIDMLIELVPNGTVAMPAIREFIEEGEGKDYLLNYLNDACKNITVKYDLYRTPISSGLLPFTLSRYDDAEISEFPLNPMVAVGKHAVEMMKHNLDGEQPTAHGPMSSWAYCSEHDAWNIGIGVDLKDFLTIFHVYQEKENWPVKDWYFTRKFIIKKGKREKEVTIRERKHKWTKYFPEQNFYNDLLKNKLLSTAIIDGIPVYAIKATVLDSFMKKQKNITYPYLIEKKDLK
jgi:aminoglycoside N3'-acetyltransferase